MVDFEAMAKQIVGVPKEDEWIFTFGIGQALAGRFVRFSGDFHEARQKMLYAFGTHWCGQYHSEHEAGVYLWGLVELELDETGKVKL